MAEGKETKMEQRWLPLEANPEVLGPYMCALGGPRRPCEKNGPSEKAWKPGESLLQFEDLVSLEPWAFGMLDCKDTVAVLLVFPLNSPNSLTSEPEGQPQVPMPAEQKQFQEEIARDIWFIRQTVPNACGTVALLHCAANLPRDRFPLSPGGFLETFLDSTREMDPAGRGASLEGSRQLASLHESHQLEGDTDAEAAADTDTHFTCLLPWRGFVLELDGRKSKPLLRSKIQSHQTFSEAAAEVVRRHFIEPRGADLRFSLLAVGDTQSAQKQ